MCREETEAAHESALTQQDRTCAWNMWVCAGLGRLAQRVGGGREDGGSSVAPASRLLCRLCSRGSWMGELRNLPASGG